MRSFLIATVAVCLGQAAQAADLPFLRGSFQDGPPVQRPMWDGFYIGGQVGYGSSDEKFSGSNSSMTSSLLANTLIEAEMGVSQWPLGFPSQSKQSSGYGGFIGYNSQWDDVVIGVEMSYLHGKFGGTSNASMSRFSLLSDNDYHTVTSSASSSIAINDIGTFRARAGYAYGAFLPYMFGGLALGQADIVRSVQVTDNVIAGPGSTTPPSLLGLKTSPVVTEGQYSHLIYGYTAGLGVDINLVGGLFARAEWEYIRFTSAVDTSINTVRAGVGYKF